MRRSWLHVPTPLSFEKEEYMQPIANYSGYHHVLEAGITFVHPTNGTLYACACEKHSTGTAQDLSIYRLRPGAAAWELVKRYTGTVDAMSQFTMGSAVIDQHGALVVACACALKTDPSRTATGFQAVWDRVPNVDAPWSGAPMRAPGEPPSTPMPEQAIALAPIDGTTWPNGGQPYAGDVVRDGKLALRLTKFLRVALELRAAVAQLQRAAQAAGWLR